MLIFWSSHKQQFARQGAFVELCPLCNQEQPFALYDVSQTDRIYGVKIAETVVDKFCSCEVCGFSMGLHKKDQIQIDSDWQISDGLAALANTLVYPLADQNAKMISHDTILVLLRRIASTKASFDVNIRPMNFLFALLASILTGGLFATLASNGFRFSSTDAFGHGFMGAIAGFGICLLALSIRDLIYHNKTKREKELRFFMGKLNLSVNDVKAVSDALASKEHKIKAIVESL